MKDINPFKMEGLRRKSPSWQPFCGQYPFLSNHTTAPLSLLRSNHLKQFNDKQIKGEKSILYPREKATPCAVPKTHFGAGTAFEHVGSALRFQLGLIYWIY
jgi:hypothetical protein